MVKDIIASPAKLALGGEVREFTWMFCDVRDCTSISEGLTASELTTFIDELRRRSAISSCGSVEP